MHLLWRASQRRVFAALRLQRPGIPQWAAYRPWSVAILRETEAFNPTSSPTAQPSPPVRNPDGPTRHWSCLITCAHVVHICPLPSTLTRSPTTQPSPPARKQGGPTRHWSCSATCGIMARACPSRRIPTRSPAVPPFRRARRPVWPTRLWRYSIICVRTVQPCPSQPVPARSHSVPCSQRAKRVAGSTGVPNCCVWESSEFRGFHKQGSSSRHSALTRSRTYLTCTKTLC